MLVIVSKYDTGLYYAGYESDAEDDDLPLFATDEGEAILFGSLEEAKREIEQHDINEVIPMMLGNWNE